MTEIRHTADVCWREDWPLLVVGAGACGLVAALAAAQRGIPVLVLEKDAALDGNTARSTGLIPAAGTRFQRAAGIHDDTPELMAHDILTKNRQQSDPALTRRLCAAAPVVVEWLVDAVGCDLVCHRDVLYPGQSRLRMHGPPAGYGAALLDQLAQAAQNDPRIELRLATPVDGLVWDGVRVSGIHCSDGAIKASAVILALNGFGANRAMVADYLGPEIAAALYFGSPHNTGEGIRWGMALGAAVDHMDAYQGHASVAAPDGPLVTWGLVVNGAVLVNRDGRRFGCETMGYSECTQAVLEQPGGEAWEIFDQKSYAASRTTRFADVIAAGKVVRADSLAELATAFGLPVAALEATIAEFNAAARGATADPLGRTEFGSGPLAAPFYGVHVRGALFHTQGGLRVDPLARVLRPGGEPIPGLYAGGGVAVGISGAGGAGYSSGNGLLAAVGLGQIAGEAVAAELYSRGEDHA
jgi:fumarate reductase flavoprotein subunit